MRSSLYNRGYEDAKNGNYSFFYVNSLSEKDKKEYMSGAALAGALEIAKVVGSTIQYFYLFVYTIAINFIYFVPSILIIYYVGYFDIPLHLALDNISDFVYYNLLPAFAIFVVISIGTMFIVRYLKGRELGNYYATNKISKTFYILSILSLFSSATFALYIVYSLPKNSYINSWYYLIYLLVVGFIVFGTFKIQFSEYSYKANLKKSRIYRNAFFKAISKKEKSIEKDELVSFIANSDFKKRDRFNIIIGISIVIIMGLIVPFALNQNKVDTYRIEYSLKDKYIYNTPDVEFSVSDKGNFSVSPLHDMNSILSNNENYKFVLLKNEFDNLDWESKQHFYIPIEYTLKNLNGKNYKLYGFFINNMVLASKSNGQFEDEYFTSIKDIEIYKNDQLVVEKTLVKKKDNQIVLLKPVSLKEDDIIKLHIKNVHYNSIITKEQQKIGKNNIGISLLQPLILSEEEVKKRVF